jgi:hypothetical protein
MVSSTLLMVLNRSNRWLVPCAGVTDVRDSSSFATHSPPSSVPHLIRNMYNLLGDDSEGYDPLSEEVEAICKDETRILFSDPNQ